MKNTQKERELFPKHSPLYRQQIPTVKSPVLAVSVPLMSHLRSRGANTLKPREILIFSEGEGTNLSSAPKILNTSYNIQQRPQLRDSRWSRRRILSHSTVGLHHSNTEGYSYSSFPLQIQLLQLNSCIPDVPPGLKNGGFTFRTKLFSMQLKLFHDIFQLK